MLFRFAPGSKNSSERLHVGCGSVILPEWINVDLEPREGVDFAIDIRKAFPFTNLSYIFAEHFLEHLNEEEGRTFLRNCFQALRAGGRIRLSTPNLDWVMATHYRWEEENAERRDAQCHEINRAFHGWGHQFLYNDTVLQKALEETGFRDVVFCRYGQSDDPVLCGLEKHETFADSQRLQHVLIPEAARP